MRNYLIVTASYWGFTLTDGALRMLVLLHFYRLGYSPFTLAFLFLLYEAAVVGAALVSRHVFPHHQRAVNAGLPRRVDLIGARKEDGEDRRRGQAEA